MQRNGWTVCAPQASTLRNLPMTRAFIEQHTLRKSPLFQRQFLTQAKQEQVRGAALICVGGE